MDWDTCIICQKTTSENLKCPLNAHGIEDKTTTYRSFLNNVNEFRILESLPVELHFGCNMSVDELVQNRGSWHKSCYVKFSNLKLDRAKKRGNTSGDSSTMEKRSRREASDKMACLLCRESNGLLHEFRTLTADTSIRRMATELQETQLLAALEGSDLIALDAKYHLQCYTALRNRYRSHLRKLEQDLVGGSTGESQIKTRALVELYSYIENCVEDGTFYFKFSKLHELYENRLKILGIEKEVNRTRLKEKLLAYFPQAQEQSDGKNKVLVFEEGMREMLQQAMSCDYEHDVILLAKTAKLVRKEITSYRGFHFNGKFPSGCQEQSVPTLLKTLVCMILNGADVSDQESIYSQANLTICQTIVFNCKKRVSASTKSRHSLEREPPLPLYIGMKIHTDTRSKETVKQLHQFGLSVSYERVLQIESQLATTTCADFREKGAVVPAQLKKGLFTVGALDNLDHNPSSMTAVGSFHGTGISLFQFPTLSNLGVNQREMSLSLAVKKNHQLPEIFTTVPVVALKTADLSVPKHSNDSQQKVGQLEVAKSEESNWLQYACKLLNKDVLEKDDSVSWSAFHASKNVSEDHEASLSQMLPMFYEKAATASMMNHGMNVVRWATEYLNSGQIPVLAVDAPLYALAKFTQWKWPNTHGEGTYIVMMGGLHIEMAMWKTFGDYLEGSGWTCALAEAGIASSGTTDSFLSASHVTRTRHSHQVTALALAKLQEDAFLLTEGPHDDATKVSWRKAMVKKSPTFQYWDTILNMELLGLIFIRSQREGNFNLYVESLKFLAPWFFALDHHNYARWIPIHIRDLENLPLSILEEFEHQGHWVIHKTKNRFSGIPIDQAHEQNNKVVKGSGGAVGLTENPSAFRKWMVSGPEQARLLKEFQDTYIPNQDKSYHHHEEGFATQKTFKEQSLSLYSVMKDFGNPFMDDNDELLTLDTRNVLDESIVNTVRTIQSVGQDQYDKYCNSVIRDCTRSIHEPIKKNNLPLLRTPIHKIKTKDKRNISLLKNDVSLFSQLYIVMQHRESDMTTFFSHENHNFPPSLSDDGNLRFGKKSDLMTILNKDSPNNPLDYVDVKLLDGSAVVHILVPTANIATFDDYADQVFIPHIYKQLESCKRVDVVWDKYIPNSLKETTREKRGKGVRRKCEGRNKIPIKWNDFLKDPTNKQELFAFLSNKLTNVDCPESKVIVVTCDAEVILRGTDRSLPSCDHEEADTRLIIHLQDALLNGCSNCMVRTVDTDVVVILIGVFHHLMTLCADLKICVAFGTGKKFTYIDINAIYEKLGVEKSLALPIFHSFTGCDTTSTFFGRGKKTAWEAWNCYPQVTHAFTYIALHPYTQLDIDSETFKLLERFTVILYDKNCESDNVNEARKELFCQKSKSMEKLPPTKDALLQHSKRAVYQAGLWCTSKHSQQHAPNPEGWGWTQKVDSESWIPVWNILPIASKACTELVKCNCKSQRGCTGRCACKTARWNCTVLCKCHCLNTT